MPLLHGRDRRVARAPSQTRLRVPVRGVTHVKKCCGRFRSCARAKESHSFTGDSSRNLKANAIHIQSRGHVCLAGFDFHQSGMRPPSSTVAREERSSSDSGDQPLTPEYDWYCLGHVVHDLLTSKVRAAVEEHARVRRCLIAVRDLRCSASDICR